jgi:hypothetical protein
MTDFVTVAIVLLLVLGLGFAMGVFTVVAFSRRRGQSYPGYLAHDGPEPPPAAPEDDERPPWYDR